MEWLNVEKLISLEDFSKCDLVEFTHSDLSERLKKTFYYAPNKNPSSDTLSLPLTKAAVENFRKAAPTPYGKLGLRYASRVARDACLSPCAIILSMIYVERLIHKNPDYLQRIQSSDLFLITMMVASKFLYDEGMSDEVYNDEWAISGQVDTDYINKLEAEFLSAIQWKVFAKRQEFSAKLLLLEARLALIESSIRGWLSYSDMSCILASNRVKDNLQLLITIASKVVCLSAVVYCGIVFFSFGFASLVCHPAQHLPNTSFRPSPIHDNRSLFEEDLHEDSPISQISPATRHNSTGPPISQKEPATLHNSTGPSISQISPATRHNSTVPPISQKAPATTRHNSTGPLISQKAPATRHNSIGPPISQISPATRHNSTGPPISQKAPATRHNSTGPLISQISPATRHNSTGPPISQKAPATRHNSTGPPISQISPATRRNSTGPLISQKAPATRHNSTGPPISQKAPVTLHNSTGPPISQYSNTELACSLSLHNPDRTPTALITRKQPASYHSKHTSSSTIPTRTPGVSHEAHHTFLTTIFLHTCRFSQPQHAVSKVQLPTSLSPTCPHLSSLPVHSVMMIGNQDVNLKRATLASRCDGGCMGDHDYFTSRPIYYNLPGFQWDIYEC